jgi:outer membrane protein TolC
LDARSADSNDARLSLIAQIASGVLSLRACGYSLDVRNRDIASRDTELRLMRRRLSAGNVASVDAANSETNLANARTERISQQEQCSRDVDALVALSGADAATIGRLVETPLQSDARIEGIGEPHDVAPPPLDDANPASLMPTPPPIQLTLPAIALLKSPGVVSAEREVAASWSEIAVARAERYPKIDLAAALTGNWLSALGTSARFLTGSLDGNLSFPLFDGGSGAGNVRVSQARYREAVANLLASVRTAARDMEDALAAQASAEQRTQTSRQAVAAGRILLRANEARWHAGAISVFELEDARRQFNIAQESEISAARDRAQAWVELVRASGDSIAPAVGQVSLIAPVKQPE